jgi:hypothetical protein
MESEELIINKTELDKVKKESYFQVLINIFLAPSIAFASLRDRPRWVVPFILCIITTMIFLVVTNSVKLEDQKSAVLANRTMSADEVQRRIENIEIQQQADLSQISIALFLLGVVLVMLNHAVLLFGLSLILWMALQLYSAKVNFKAILSICSFSNLVLLPETILKIPLVLMKDTLKIYLGLAAFLPPEWENSPLFNLCEHLDIFSIWIVVLLMIALPITSGISKKKSIITVGYLWGIWLLLSMFLGNFTLFGFG